MNSSNLTAAFYVSRCAASSAQVESIVTNARWSNGKRNLTGGLLYTGNFFAQVLEGPCAEVNRTISAISADSRHQNMNILFQNNVDFREFGSWTMGYLAVPGADQIIQPLVEREGSTAAVFRLRGLLLEWIRNGIV